MTRLWRWLFGEPLVTLRVEVIRENGDIETFNPPVLAVGDGAEISGEDGGDRLVVWVTRIGNVTEEDDEALPAVTR